jgi:CHAD domain-containing protein
MNKEEQKRLLTEIMDADAKDGIYEPTVSKMETTQQKDHIGDTNKMVTAVEWLLKNLKDKLSIEQANAIISQAKAMEKEQIIKARIHGDLNGKCKIALCNEDAEKYYNETYNK